VLDAEGILGSDAEANEVEAQERVEEQEREEQQGVQRRNDTDAAAEVEEGRRRAATAPAPPRGPGPPAGLTMTESLPGQSLPELAEKLNTAVVQAFKGGLYDACVVDMTPFGIEECYGDVANAVAEVVVSANAAETAGRFNMALRRKELRRLRSALWDLRVILERSTKDRGSCTLTVRHRLEALRSASLDVCHPQQRAADAPPASAIPNFQVVHQDFAVDAVPSGIESLDDDVKSALCLPDGPEVAFFRGGQPTAEGRAWMVSRAFKTVIDLRLEDRDNQWTRPLGGGYGAGHTAPERQLDVVHIPVTDMEPPSFEAVEAFIAVANDTTRRPMYVHCKAGIGRTGSMVSCWRISHGMDVDDALALESLCCDFGSIAQEAFVRSFAERHEQHLRAAARASSSATKASESAPSGPAPSGGGGGGSGEGRGRGGGEGEGGARCFDESAPPIFAVEKIATASAATLASSPTGASASFGVVNAVEVSAAAAAAAAAVPTGATGPSAGTFYDGAGFHEDDTSLVPSNRVSSLLQSPDGTGSGGSVDRDTVAAVYEHSDLSNAPDMYVIRTDGFTCSREEVEERMLKISHPSTQQLVLVWRKPPTRIFVLKKLGTALLPQLVEVAHAMMSMGFQVIVEEGVLGEMKATTEMKGQWGGVDSAAPSLSGSFDSHSAKADDIRDAVLAKVGSLKLDAETGRIPREDWGTIDVIVCLGGDGVILHASKLFQGPVPPLLGFHFGSMGFLTNHPPDKMAQSLLRSVGRGKPAHNIKGGVPITLRMRLECTLVKAHDSTRNGGAGGSSHSYTVLNEVLVDRGPSPFLSKIEAYDRGQLITTIQADGVMLATATGSTAYSVSAGGSMVHPNVPAILMTPICPHTLSFRPVVLPDSVEVELRVADDARCSAWVSFDGKERRELCSGDSLFIRMSQFPVPTINYADQTGDFISSLRRCLRWNEREEQKPLDEQTMKELRKISGSGGFDD